MDGNNDLCTAEKQGPFQLAIGSAPKFMTGLIVPCALTGLFVIGSRVFSLIRLIFSLFILPGRPVSPFRV